MLKLYRIRTTTYVNSKPIDFIAGHVITDKPPESSTTNLTWDDIEDYARSHLDTWIKHKKKGRVLEVYHIDEHVPTTYKEWKMPNLEICKTTEVEEVHDYSVRKLLDMFAPSPAFGEYLAQEFGLDNLVNIIKGA